MTQLIECVIEKCDWRHVIAYPDPRITEHSLADIFGPGVFAATANAQVQREAEEAIAEHYRSHSILELFQTCARRTVELGEAQATVVKLHRLLHPEPGDKVFGYTDGGARIEGILMTTPIIYGITVAPHEAVIGFAEFGEPKKEIVFRDSLRGLG